MKVCLLGSRGSMGQRYIAILNHLRVPYFAIDVDSTFDSLYYAEQVATHFIIATPTHTHFDQIIKYAFDFKNKPVLCEKPLSKNKKELQIIFDAVRNRKFSMMMQYEMLDSKWRRGETVYDYFRHGNDGLYWDCLQPIGLARGPIRLAEKSPVWACRLNGKKLHLSQMDKAYVEFVKRWLSGHNHSVERLADIHDKVIDFASGKAA